MRIFITGASGYVGSVVAEKAIKQGHEVLGLVRSDASEKKVKALGVTPIRGSLDDTILLTKTAESCDAVLHLGFNHDFSRPYEELINTDINAIKALAKGLNGANKALIMTSGSGISQANPGHETNEDSPIVTDSLAMRAESEDAALKNANVRGMAVRLAPYVYGRGGSFFVPVIMTATAKHGFAPYVNDGEHMTSSCDVDAAADLYLLAMEKGKAGSIFNCTTETDVRFKDIAQAIATALNVSSKSVTPEEAAKVCDPFTARLMAVENRASSRKAQTELGWHPAPALKLVDDITNGSYKQFAQELKKELAAR